MAETAQLLLIFLGQRAPFSLEENIVVGFVGFGIPNFHDTGIALKGDTQHSAVTGIGIKH